MEYEIKKPIVRIQTTILSFNLHVQWVYNNAMVDIITYS